MKEFGPLAEKEKVPSIDAPLAEHVRYLFRHIFGLTFRYEEHGLTRYIHGIFHVARAAIFIPVIANLYRKFGDQEAMAISNEELRLILIAALLHDAGREGDGEDLWDKDSGILTYKYLTKLGVSKEKAKLLAEAVTNKDTTTENVSANEITNEHYEELDISGSEPIWRQVPKKKKNIYQCLIHDVDCLDIIRVRSIYEGTYLDFFKQIIKDNCDKMDTYPALDHLEELIIEAKTFINETEADEFRKQFENEDCLNILLKHIEDKPLLSSLYSEKSLLSETELQKISFTKERFNPKIELNEKNALAALREGKVFARTMESPSKEAVVNNNHLHKDKCINKEKYKTESILELELRKINRRKGLSTGSSKENNKEKQGNPNRSISMIGYRRGVYHNVGYLLINPSLDNIGKISASNAGTGFGKKKFDKELTNNKIKKQQLDELLWKFKLSRGEQSTYGHTEILCDIEEYQAVFFTNDNGRSSVNLSNELQAIYMQEEYKKVFGKVLPIFEYSVIGNSLTIKTYHDDDLVKLWSKIYKEKLGTMSIKELFSAFQQANNVNDIFGIVKSFNDPDEYFNIDINYSNELKEKINHVIFDLIIEKMNVKPDHVPALLAILTNSKDKTLLFILLNKCKLFNKNDLFTLILAVAEKDNKEVMDVLLANGIDINQQNETGEIPLVEATRIGNINMVNILLNSGANPKEVNKNGDTPLYIAVVNGNHDIIMALLNKNASPNWTNNNSKNSIVLDTGTSNAELYRVLINYGDIIDHVDGEGMRLMHRAVINNNLSLLELLLEKDHSLINSQTNDGNTPLHIAVIKDTNKELIKFLISKGANLNVKNAQGMTPIELAMNFGSDKTLELLLNCINYQTNLNAFNIRGYNMLHIAVSSNNNSLVKCLLENDRSLINIQAKNNDTALDLAIYESNAPMVQILLSAGANLNSKNSKNHSTLDEAFDTGNLAVINAIYDGINDSPEYHESINTILLFATKKNYKSFVAKITNKYPSFVNKINADGKTLLEVAITHSNTDIVELLIRLGANIDIKCSSNETPLQMAIRCGGEAMTKILLANKPDMNLKEIDKDGNSYLQLAIKSKKYSLAMLLIEKEPEIIKLNSKTEPSAINLAVKGDSIELVICLIKSGINPFLIERDGCSAFELTLSDQNIAMAEAIIDLTDDITPYREMMKIALNYGCQHNHTSLVKKIIEKDKTLINEKFNVNGRVPLYLAIVTGSTEVACYLLDHHADVNLIDINGKTAIDYALFCNNDKLFEALLDFVSCMPDLKKYNDTGINALHLAAKNNNIPLVIKLLKLDPSLINTQTSFGDTAIHWAVLTKNPELVKILLEYGENPFIQNANSVSAFNDSSYMLLTDITEIIIDMTKDISSYRDEMTDAFTNACLHHHNSIATKIIEKDNTLINKKIAKHNWFPLHTAVFCSNFEVLDFLIKNGANLNVVDNNGNTPVNFASDLSKSKTIIALAEAGADLTLANKDGITPLDYARKNNNQEIIDLITRYISNRKVPESSETNINTTSQPLNLSRLSVSLFGKCNREETDSDNSQSPDNKIKCETNLQFQQ